MLIDPWIVLAEIFNFLILVAVLQRFLYKPIMRTMAEREKSIADRLQLATERETEAQAQIEQYQQLQANWAEQTQSRKHQMQQQLEEERASRIDQMRLALETQRVQWDEALRQEQKASLVDLRDRARSQLIQTVRATLNTLANSTLEQQMVDTFLTQLPNLLPNDLSALKAAVATQSDLPIWTIRSAFPLDESLKQRLIDGLSTQMEAPLSFNAFTFETYADYPCGIELRIEGYKLAWHMEHYLESLESRLAYDLDQVSVF